jgi:hypothetical protein
VKRLAVALAAIPASFALADCWAWQIVRHAPAPLATDLAQPLPVATSWHGTGLHAWSALAACLGLAFCGYALALRELLRDGQGRAPLPPRKILPLLLLCAALTLALGLRAPILYSSDVYAYAAYGDLALRGFNPYRHAALPAGDALLRAAIWQWGNPPPVCVYGPLFVLLLEGLVAAFARAGVAAQLLAIRLAACAALLLAAFLLDALLRGREAPRRRAAVAAFVLNPTALWSAAEGHNDALMLCVALGGLLIARRFRARAGAFVVGLCPLVKLPGIAAAVLLPSAAFPGLCAGLLTSAAFALPFATGLLDSLAPHARYAPQFSLQGMLVSAVGVPLGIMLALTCCALLAVQAVRMARRGERQGLPLLALAAWCAIPNPYPWYALWILPVAAVTLETPAGSALAVATFSILLRYLPDAWGTLDRQMNTLVAALELIPPLVAGLPAAARARSFALGRPE